MQYSTCKHAVPTLLSQELVDFRDTLAKAVPSMRQKQQVSKAIEAARYVLALFEADTQIKCKGWTSPITAMINELAICLGEVSDGEAGENGEHAASLQ